LAKKKIDDTEYKRLKADLKDGTPGTFYIFHGEERYLLEYYLDKLRDTALAGGFEEFNEKRFDGKTVTPEELSAAVDALPVFTARTFIRVDDLDLFGAAEGVKKDYLAVLSDLPDYVCLVMVYDTVEYKVDGRLKINNEIKKLASIVEFHSQTQSDLINWVRRRFHAMGKDISNDAAEYFIFTTGGLMTAMVTETEKVGAYAMGSAVTRQDIDAVVTPVTEAVAFRLTDAVVQGKFDDAAKLLSDLLLMQEPPHKLIYSISAKMRQLLAAKVLWEQRKNAGDLMELMGIRYDFQARSLMESARRISMQWCENAVALCSEAALQLNSSSDKEQTLSLLLMRLAAERKGAIA
jgi:DNA polymerase-3 subunit delta